MPAKAALVHNGVPWSYAAFARAIVQARSRFASAGLRPAGVAVVAIDRLVEGWIATLALRSLGFTTVAVGRSMSVEILALRDVSGVVTTDGASHRTAETLVRQTGCPMPRLPEARPEDFAKGPVPDLPPIAGGLMAGHILLTSATTGRYKKVLREPRADAETVGQVAAIYGIAPSSVFYTGVLPIFTLAGYRLPRAGWHTGATVVLEQSATPGRPFGRLAITHAVATPAMLVPLLDAPGAAQRRAEGLRLFVTAGPLPKSLLERLRARLAAEISTAYGATEFGTIAMTRIEGEEDLYWHRPIAAAAVEVVDDSGRLLPAGEVGLVRVRTARGIEGYLDDEAATREFFRDGYFYPGDLGRLRADGRFCLQGRVTDVINVLGYKIATGPLERKLEDRLGAAGVCIFSQQGAEAAEEVHVAIEASGTPGRAPLEEFARKDLGAFRKVHFHFVASLPRNTMGKIQRNVLRQLILGNG